MGKSILFKIIGYPLITVASFGAVYGGFKIKDLKTDRDNLTKIVTEITEENKTLKDEKEKLKQEVFDLGVKLVNSNNKVTSLEEEKQKAITELDATKTTLNETQEELNIAKNNLKTEEAKVLTLTNEKTQLEQDKSNLQSNLDNVNSQLTTKTNEYIKVCEDLETANGNVAELQSKKSELENTIQTLETTKTNLQSQLDEKTTAYNEKVSELETANNMVTSLNTQITDLQSNILELEFHIQKLETEIEQKDAKIEDLENTILTLKQRIEELESGQTEEPTTLSAGLYETGTTNLTKSWEQLITDGDISITDGALKCENKTLTGDLILPKIDGLQSLDSAFSGCANLSKIDFRNLDTSQVYVMAYLFEGCSSLTTLDLSMLNTENLQNACGMFSGCSSLQSLDISNFNTSNVTAMSSMFEGCSVLENLDTCVTVLNTSKVTSMRNMFADCRNITSLNLSTFDTSLVTDMYGMFFNCDNLKSIDLSSFNTINVTDMAYMFNYCNSLISISLNNFDTSKVTNMAYMFNFCEKLSSLNLSNFNTVNVTSMAGMFQNCTKLNSLDITSFNTSNVTNMSEMFEDCSSLSSLDISTFDFSKVYNINLFLSGMTLITLNFPSFENFDINAVIPVGMLQFTSDTSSCNITYPGTIAEWKSKRLTYETTGLPNNLTIHCSDGDYVTGSVEEPEQYTTEILSTTLNLDKSELSSAKTITSDSQTLYVLDLGSLSINDPSIGDLDGTDVKISFLNSNNEEVFSLLSTFQSIHLYYNDGSAEGADPCTGFIVNGATSYNGGSTENKVMFLYKAYTEDGQTFRDSENNKSYLILSENLCVDNITSLKIYK